MGITFRSGEYLRFVRLGGRTIKDGEAAAIWNRRGEHQQIIGPRRVILWYSTIRFLTRYKAESHQYLKVKHRDGTVKHVQGPASVYLNPSLHDEILVLDGIQLKENEVIQVCRISTSEDGANIEEPISKPHSLEEMKRMVHGPTLFIPGEDEFVEEFEWSILPDELGGRGIHDRKLMGTFSKVKLHTSNVWNVKVALGNESRKVFASLSITYKIDKIEKVALHQDPCMSLCAALMLDVQESLVEEVTAATVSAAATNYLQSIQASVTKQLSQYESFRHLRDAAGACGFSIEDAKLVEVAPGEQLREEISREHESATKAKIEVENKKRQISFQELELEESQKRIENEDALSRKAAKIQANLAEEIHNQKMKALDQENDLEKTKEQRQRESWKASDQVVLEFLGGLKELGVDMSAFLCTDDGKKATAGILKRAPSLAPLTEE